MNKTPHFVLFSRTGEHSTRQGGSWHFRLESAAGEACLEAADIEPNVTVERLELLAVVRGLEALEQPSTVTLVTPSPQISRAVRQGLEYWRNRNWKWERFGEKVPMKNGDLWQRVDQAMQIHDVRCRLYRMDRAHGNHSRHVTSARGNAGGAKNVKLRGRCWRPTRPLIAMVHWMASSMHWAANVAEKMLPDSPPNPHPSL